MYQIRWHGRGGAGAVTAAMLLGAAAINEGFFAQAFPAFGPERRGAPVQAFTRLAQEQIRVRSQVYDPDCVIVMDDSLLDHVDILQGLKEDGQLIINTNNLKCQKKFPSGLKIWLLDATGIALKNLGRPIVNTTLLGAFCAVTGMVKPDSLEKTISSEFGATAEMNIKALYEAYDLLKRGEGDSGL